MNPGLLIVLKFKRYMGEPVSGLDLSGILYSDLIYSSLFLSEFNICLEFVFHSCFSDFIPE